MTDPKALFVHKCGGLQISVRTFTVYHSDRESRLLVCKKLEKNDMVGTYFGPRTYAALGECNMMKRYTTKTVQVTAELSQR